MLLLKVVVYSNCLALVLGLTSCHKLQSCRSCVAQSSWWSGQSCRWCRLTSSCHAFMSADNECNGAEDVHDRVADWQRECRLPLGGRFNYDPQVGYKALLASAAAYHQPGRCIKNSLPQLASYRVVRDVTVQCDDLLPHSQCAGYVAVSVRERTLLVAFRGSTTLWQVVKQALESLAVPKEPFLDGHVQRYFSRAFGRLWPKMRNVFRRLRARHADYHVLVTGHSLGGAIASLASLHMVHSGSVPRDRLVLYTFGMPRVGDYDYALQHSRLVPHSMRVVNGHDPVPHYPSKTGIPSTTPYHHGLEVYYDQAETADSEWRECRGLPFNEDLECGWSAHNHLLNDHFVYFGVRVGAVCWNHTDLAAV